MSRTSNFSAEYKLKVLNEMKKVSAKAVARRYGIHEHTIRTWQIKYKYQGIEGLRPSHQNQHYSKVFKFDLVQRYQTSNDSLDVFAIKNGLRSKRQLTR
jgi:transposase-like protein